MFLQLKGYVREWENLRIDAVVRFTTRWSVDPSTAWFVGLTSDMTMLITGRLVWYDVWTDLFLSASLLTHSHLIAEEILQRLEEERRKWVFVIIFRTSSHSRGNCLQRIGRMAATSFCHERTVCLSFNDNCNSWRRSIFYSRYDDNCLTANL